LAVREGAVDTGKLQEGFRGAMEFLEMGGHDGGGRDRSDGMMGGLARMMTQYKDFVGAVTMRQQISFSLEREPEAAARFGTFATAILDAPILSVFADIVDDEAATLTFEHTRKRVSGDTAKGETGKGSGGDGQRAEEQGGERKMDRVVEYLTQLMSAGADKKRCTTPGLDLDGMRSQLRGVESGMRMFSGDTAGAAKAIQAEIAREALSSTSGTGWQRLAELHMFSHTLAVSRAAQPDYRKGLTHLKEWWKLHQGVGVSKMDLCYGHLKFVTCYHELDQLTDASRSVIKLVETGQTLCPADCMEGDVPGAQRWLHEQIAKFEKLHCFLDPAVVFSRAPSVAALSLRERVMMHQIITNAKAVAQERLDLEETMRRAKESARRTREVLKTFSLAPTEENKVLMEKVDKWLDEPEPKKPDFWLF
jgi:hypothetical protein